jgi:hypothetical protein
MFQETDKRFKETEKLIKEAAEEHRETAREVKEASRAVREAAKAHEETERAVKEMSERMDKSKRELDRRMGDLGNRFGELTEHLVAPSINEKFNALGFHFDAVGSGDWHVDDPVTGRDLAEIDILLQNTECMVAVEVKSKLQERYIEGHIKRVEVLRVWADKHKDHRKIYGAMAGAIVTPEVRRQVVKAGFYAIVQTGDTVKIDVPEGFIPRYW